ncbi:769_t:CDS:2 [Paraglomus brasilianum]|uniref:769_t:CDS:1 n=1 Tax=Paraglomus brasilianum TaxID=144538 RepID=A0A9N9BKX7_9GLOM|nr:769_t:CDS:2 [Paraglomus brasilianum]
MEILRGGALPLHFHSGGGGSKEEVSLIPMNDLNTALDISSSDAIALSAFPQIQRFDDHSFEMLGRPGED